jgi:hypothetical protein
MKLSLFCARVTAHSFTQGYFVRMQSLDMVAVAFRSGRPVVNAVSPCVIEVILLLQELNSTRKITCHTLHLVRKRLSIERPCTDVTVRYIHVLIR